MLVAIDAVGIRMGGGATLLSEFLRWLPGVRPEWEWLVFLLPRHGREFDDPPAKSGLKIETVAIGDSALGRLWWLYGELPRRIERAGVDVLFAFANVASPRCPVPQVVYVHQRLAFQAGTSWVGLDPRRIRLRLLRGLILRGAQRTGSAIVQTQDMRRRLESATPQLSGRVHVVPGCVSDLGLSGEIRPDKQRLIDQCTWPRLVYIAHPAQHKNHVTLIRALPRILERYPDTKLLLTMEPHARNGMVDTGCVRRIQQLAEELGLGNHVVWLGVLSPQEVRYLLRQATVSVFPSLDESFGLPLAEIITEGCPLAASDRPFARDVAGKAAEYFDPLDPDSIARCVTALIGTPQRLEQLRREARERQVCFQPQKVAEQVARILEAAVDHQRDGHARVGTEVC